MTRCRVSLHNHVGGPGAAADAARGVALALEHELDVVAFLSHNHCAGYDGFRARWRELLPAGYRCRELFEGVMEVRQQPTGRRLLLLQANEVSTQHGEVVAAGAIGQVLNCRDRCGEPTAESIGGAGKLRRCVGLGELLRLNPQLAGEQVILCAPHPLDRQTGLARAGGVGPRGLRELLEAGTLHSYEVFNGVVAGLARIGLPGPPPQGQVLARQLGRQGLAGNDGLWRDVARSHTAVQIPDGTPAEGLVPAVATALRRGQGLDNVERPVTVGSLLRRALTSRRNPLVRLRARRPGMEW